MNKLLRAGADRVVNPQEIGGARIAAFVSRPRVTDFLDVVMHSRETELLLEEITLAPDSAFVGLSLGEAKVRDRTGALVLALHDPHGGFVSNPGGSVVMTAEQTLIAIGTPAQLENLATVAGGRRTIAVSVGPVSGTFVSGDRSRGSRSLTHEDRPFGHHDARGEHVLGAVAVGRGRPPGRVDRRPP